jgi:hypothetical protein
MPTKLFIVTKPPEGGYQLPDGTVVEHAADLPVGAMWRCDCHGELGWLIVLPHQKSTGREWARLWCTKQQAGDGLLWTVTGEAPNITVSPSINCLEPGGWHGFIQNGVISDGSYNT